VKYLPRTSFIVVHKNVFPAVCLGIIFIFSIQIKYLAIDVSCLGYASIDLRLGFISTEAEANQYLIQWNPLKRSNNGLHVLRIG
jgi:hypothetical protein